MSKAVIISGEALDSESEEEGYDIVEELNRQEKQNVKPSISASSSIKTNVIYEEKSPEKYSLLHKRLRESNAAFYNSLHQNITSVVDSSKLALDDIDQQTLKSQLNIQGAITLLKQVNAQSNLIKNKLDDLLSSNFLSNTKVIT